MKQQPLAFDDPPPPPRESPGAIRSDESTRTSSPPVSSAHPDGTETVYSGGGVDWLADYVAGRR